jgi:L-asparaginase/Glu-tRNA(Gln) amidotransferase subunit D
MSMLFVLLFTLAVADAKGPGQLPNVMVLATGGTIAGTGASSTATIGYTAATVGIEPLLKIELSTLLLRNRRLSGTIIHTIPTVLS